MKQVINFKEIAVDVISILFIILFVYAGLSKLLDYQKFYIQIGKSPLLTHFAGWIAWVIPVIEILVSIMLSQPRWRLGGLYASFSLMVMFTAYIITILKFSAYVPCSCGGILQKMSWDDHLRFNMVFIFIGLSGIFLQSSKKDKSRVWSETVSMNK